MQKVKVLQSDYNIQHDGGLHADGADHSTNDHSLGIRSRLQPTEWHQFQIDRQSRCTGVRAAGVWPKIRLRRDSVNQRL